MSGGISYEKLTIEIERKMEKTKITASNLQGGKIGPMSIKECRKEVWKRMKIDEFMNNLAHYTKLLIQDFKSFLRTEIDLVEDINGVVLDENISSFITWIKTRYLQFWRAFWGSFKNSSNWIWKISQRNWYWNWWFYHEN